MKIKSLMLGMMASAAFVACTNDVETVENGAIQAGEKGYVAVNIVTPNSISGRALTEDDFQAGTADEVKVKDALFLFLDRNYAGCAKPFHVVNFGEWDGSASGLGQDKSKRVLVINGSKDEVPSYIVAILNPTATHLKYDENTTLNDMKADHANFSAITSNLVMSNAVYAAENGKEVVATPISLENIAHSAAELENDDYKPVTIQVERVVAKVAVTSLNDAVAKLNANKDEDGLNDVIDDQENLKLKFVLTGWNVLQNKESNLIKNINALEWSMSESDWNDATLKRSYWANDYIDALRTQYTVNSVDSLTNTSFKYVEETVNQDVTANNAMNDVSPYLLVTGKFVDATDETKAIDLVEWRGQKYTKQGYLNLIAGMPEISKYYTAVTTGEGEDAVTTYTSFTADLLKLEDNKDNDWGATAVLGKNVDFYTVSFLADGVTVDKTKVVKVETSEVVDAIEKFGQVQYWNGGNTYYFVPIKHKVVNDKESYHGVVRNHVYQMDIKNISGYGTPVSNPNQAIDVPEKPTDDNSYMEAEVVILDWKVVKQDVELE